MPIDYTQPHMTAFVKEISSDKAVLVLENGQEIILPQNKLPKNAKVADTIKMLMASDQDLLATRQEIAKDVLNEILRNE